MYIVLSFDDDPNFPCGTAVENEKKKFNKHCCVEILLRNISLCKYSILKLWTIEKPAWGKMRGEETASEEHLWQY